LKKENVMAKIPQTELDVYPICLGGNVFGWSADEAQSFAVLDAYVEAGGNFIDTADTYSAWVPGHTGGESEAIIGRWLAARKLRNEVIVATKVGQMPGFKGLSGKNIRAAVEGSLKRLGVERIDLYYAHRDDPETPLAETLGAFGGLVREGKVKHVAASNYSAARLREALDTSRRNGLPSYVALQPHYNLVHRQEYEAELAALCAQERIANLPYFALAKGFLTGKYRPGRTVESVRASGAEAYLDERGTALLAALDEIAAAHQTTLAAVSLAWLLSKPTVVAPIASARTVEQLRELLPAATLRLEPAALARLDELTKS
jgi:aryl-alcohol dehydrogenase-like predicted oxidoreductase